MSPSRRPDCQPKNVVEDIIIKVNQWNYVIFFLFLDAHYNVEAVRCVQVHVIPVCDTRFKFGYMVAVQFI